MDIKGIDKDELLTACSVANMYYDGNLRIRDNRPAVNGVRFTLAVDSSKGPGAKVTGKNFNKPRPGTNVCWHGHRDLFAAALLCNPDAQIRSVVAVYNGAADFLGKFLGTGRHNIGSPVLPQPHWDACNCANPYEDGALVRLLKTAMVAA